MFLEKVTPLDDGFQKRTTFDNPKCLMLSPVILKKGQLADGHATLLMIVCVIFPCQYDPSKTVLQ